MTGKVIDSGANGLLLVLLPLALVIMVVFVAWPLILGIFVLSLGWKLWQTYQWQQLCAKIDPLFNQLIPANQGKLTVLDISLKTGLDANTAKWYLDRKTNQYGAVKRLYQDKGIVYYFLTASALGSIFDDSDSNSDIEPAPVTATPLPSSTTALTATNSEASPSNHQTDSPQESESVENNTETITAPAPEQIVSELGEEISTAELTLNQSELAKRLEVSPSTVAKRKSEDDFPVWSQSRDPDGIPWLYDEEEKIFHPYQSG
ncbi:MAG: hypothetical protein IGQ45_15565 [Cyanobacterium sp. T60_A2020_053]|nr:hypothetical protein [Cyanobacterium sp. T60_A2020_053]